MANVVTTQTLLDGPRKLVVLLTAVLDASNEARAVKVDVSALDPAPLKVRVDKIGYSISAGLQVVLDWDATAPVNFAALTDSGELEACSFGGLQNTADTGITGDIYLTTLGYSTGTATYTLLLEMTKVSF